MDLENETFSNFTLEELATGKTSKVMISLSLSVLTTLTTIINSLVITAIIVTKKLHHPANYLICSLAVTDLLVAVLVMPFSIIYTVKETWVMGQVVCNIWLSVDITCCTCSILHLAAIALDRYRAITNAVEYAQKRTPKRAGIMITIVWVISIFISLPPMFWRHQGNNKNDECLIKHDHLLYTIYSTFGAFYIPLALILILYYKIYRAAKTLYYKRSLSRRINEDVNDRMSIITAKPPRTSSTVCISEKSTSDPSPTEEGENVHNAARGFNPSCQQDKTQKRLKISGTRERKAATTLGLILGAFVICWLPFFLKEVIVNVCESCSVSPEISDFLTWLGYLNSLINPLIYTIFNEDFKRAFQKLVRCR
ncbi:5-hydroxytryptamine receptor 1F [Amblyraja radiata]|uniref:5-hydroxytryptamine receptor 1F n=1 Tax=Amblyraja radiata TaxID=386614 RepID=UPI0014037BE6|nr:5-hydroxytryptamine receptor 1F [Amblyraja radiata]